LQLSPQEIFRGDAVGRLLVTTNQGACLPEILLGDQWLFYLRRDENSGELLLDYGSPSNPVAAAERDITRLRRLAAMSDSGLIVGSIQERVRHHGQDGGWTDFVDLKDHKITAKRVSDNAEYSARTDENGDFEFEPLPAGSYQLSANTKQGLWAEDGPTTIRARGCGRYQFELHVDGVISGHVRSGDGKPFKIHPWVDVESQDGGENKSVYADERGYFEARGLDPGRYLIGIGIGAEPNTPEWRSRIYYPGVRTKEKAIVVELGKAEKRANLDIELSNSASR
jgi:hypothetical protein